MHSSGGDVFTKSSHQTVPIPLGQELCLKMPATSSSSSPVCVTVRVLTGKVQSLGAIFEPNEPARVLVEQLPHCCCSSSTYRFESLAPNTQMELICFATSPRVDSSNDTVSVTLRPVDARLEQLYATTTAAVGSLDQQQQQQQPSTIMFTGSTDVGKSTLSETWVNRLLREDGLRSSCKDPVVVMVDADIGQQSLGVPGSIGVAVHHCSSSSLLLPGTTVKSTTTVSQTETVDSSMTETHVVSFWVGDLSVGSKHVLERYRNALTGVQNLLKTLEESLPVAAVIINTCGFIKGAGLRALEWITRLLNVTDIVAIHSGNKPREHDLFERALTQMIHGVTLAMGNQIRLHTLSRPLNGVATKSKQERLIRRSRQWMMWFLGPLVVSTINEEQTRLVIQPSLVSVVLRVDTKDVQFVDAITHKCLSLEEIQTRLMGQTVAKQQKQQQHALPAALYPLEAMTTSTNSSSKEEGHDSRAKALSSLPVAGYVLLLSVTEHSTKLLAPAPGPLPSHTLYVSPSAIGPSHHFLPFTAAEP